MKILVVGDYISDVYTFGRAERLCPEAPVPVLIPEDERTSDGGAGLVANQLIELGAETFIAFGSHSIKHRYFAGSHLICRVDNDSYSVTPIDPSEFEGAGAYVVADYGKGAMTRELASQIVSTLKPVFVDAKRHWDWYTGPFSIAFPNEHEAANVNAGDWARVVQKLGAKGCVSVGIEGHNSNEPATVTEVVDVTGAGDIFMAAFVYAWTLRLPAEDCLRFANEIAGESCRHIGTHVVPRQFAQEVLDRLRASRGSQLSVRDLTRDSMPEVPERYFQQVQELQQAAEKATGIQYADFAQEPGDRTATGVELLLRAQIPPESPLGPTGSSDARIPTDQESSDESGTKSQTTLQSQSPISNEHQHERKLARDQVWHPKRS
jgi:bifunctional ADP-heptose synthase (sugar kinase/adenylyltransferase)